MDEIFEAKVEVERAWARARRPGPNFWLALNKPQARGSTSLILRKAGLSLNFKDFISNEFRLKAGLMEIFTGSRSFGLDNQSSSSSHCAQA